MKKDKKLNIQEYELPITFQEDDGGFVATCPAWKDCFAQGETVEEVINEISYVASSLIELYKEEGLKVPLKLKNASEQKANNFSLSIPVIVSTF